MKLCLLTYKLAQSWDLPKIVKVARALGYAGIEARAEAGHKHGVEIEATPAQRREIRERMQDAYLEMACIGTSSRFESPDPVQRRAMIDNTKRYAELAADVGCRRIRVFGNVIPAGVAREDCVQYVGESLAELGTFAGQIGVDVLLEMHGQFNFWGFALDAVHEASNPFVGLVYNSDPKDLVGGSLAATYGRVREHIRHVHMHDFAGSFPYPELFELLQEDGYEGYLSSEVEVDAPTNEQYLAMYAHLFRAWAGMPFSATQNPG